MKVKLNYLVFVGLVLLLSACSKEKRVERYLKRGVGEWQVKTDNVRFYKNDTLQSDENWESSMKLIFDEKGRFLKAGYTDDTQTMVNNFSIFSGTWTNTKDEIIVQSLNGYTIRMKILDIEKKKMKLEYAEAYSSEKYVHTLSLEKED